MQDVSTQMWVMAVALSVVAVASMAALAIVAMVGARLVTVFTALHQLVETSDRTMEKLRNELAILAPVTAAISGISRIVSAFRNRDA
jgi:hypothetical protein